MPEALPRPMLYLDEVTHLDPGMALPPDLPHYEVPYLHIIDYDDTLARPDTVVDRLVTICEGLKLGHALNAEIVQETRDKAHEQGTSADIVKLLRAQLGDELALEVRERFRRGQGKDPENSLPMAFPDTDAYVRSLRAPHAVPNMVLTYGEGVNDYKDGGLQRDKLELAASEGLWTGFACITHEKVKGPIITSLQSSDGRYELVGVDRSGTPQATFTAERALHVDDCKPSFGHSPKNLQPYHIRRPVEKAAKKQLEGQLPPGAITIAALADIPVSHEHRPLNAQAKRRPLKEVDIAAFVPIPLLSGVGSAALAGASTA